MTADFDDGGADEFPVEGKATPDFANIQAVATLRRTVSDTEALELLTAWDPVKCRQVIAESRIIEDLMRQLTDAEKATDRYTTRNLIAAVCRGYREALAQACVDAGRARLHRILVSDLGERSPQP